MAQFEPTRSGAEAVYALGQGLPRIRAFVVRFSRLAPASRRMIENVRERCGMRLLWYVSAFTQGNVLPMPPANTLQLARCDGACPGVEPYGLTAPA